MILNSKEYSFFVYWQPQEDKLELRQIGNLRPPDELVKRALNIVKENTSEDYKTMSDSSPVHIGKVKVGFAYSSENYRKNKVLPKCDSFEGVFEVVTLGSEVGDPVAGEYQKKHKMGKIIGNYPYQTKGWKKLNGKYYNPSENKPGGWTNIED